MADILTYLQQLLAQPTPSASQPKTNVNKAVLRPPTGKKAEGQQQAQAQMPRRQAPPDTGTVDQELRQLFYRAFAKKRSDDAHSAWRDTDRTTWDRLSGLYGTDSQYWPVVPHNSATPTEVIGSPSLARDVETLMSIAPILRGSVKSVTSGPTGSVMRSIANSEDLNQDASNFERSNLLGQMDRQTREVAINPRLSWFENFDTPASFLPEDPSERFATLAHEFGHAAGLDHSRELSNIEGVARMRDEFVRRRKPSR